VCLANGQSRPPHHLTGGWQRKHPVLPRQHEPAWRPGGWGGVTSLMWLSPAGSAGPAARLQRRLRASGRVAGGRRGAADSVRGDRGPQHV